jgi:hypothetical protein
LRFVTLEDVDRFLMLNFRLRQLGRNDIYLRGTFAGLEVGQAPFIRTENLSRLQFGGQLGLAIKSEERLVR